MYSETTGLDVAAELFSHVKGEAVKRFRLFDPIYHVR